MTALYSPQVAGVYDGSSPPAMLAGNLQRAKLRSMVMSLDLSVVAQQITTADSMLIGYLPVDAIVHFGIINASVTMGASATLAIGTNATHASNGQYRAAAVFTAAAPTLFGVAANMFGAAATAPVAVYLTNGVANLPTAGILQVELFFSTRS